MFQNFEVTADPEASRARLPLLRAAMAEAGVAAFLVPRTDRYRGETVAPCDERLAWITGFTGSAGIAVIGLERAAVFVDSRYRLQVRHQVDTDAITPMPVPESKVEDWLIEATDAGARIGYDPWLHTVAGVKRLGDALAKSGRSLHAVDNLVDAVWDDRPAPPLEPARPHALEFAGVEHADKRAEIAKALREVGVDAFVLTVPESVAWVLNIRGSDVPNTPVVHASCILRADGSATLFIDPAKRTPALEAHLGSDVEIADDAGFLKALAGLRGAVGLDKASVPVAVRDAISDAKITWMRDPCVLPRACKNPVELAGARRAGDRDAVAVISFLAWLDRTAPGGSVTEIDAARKLESLRAANNALRDISFETISGAGANGAIVHYRVTTDTNALLKPGSLYLVDSGGQYADGTTDITRTIAIGTPPEDAARCFTLVLKGMIGISRLRWPAGLAGRDIDAVARLALWQAGLDYGHGTGHGIGSYLGVHEGPQALSRRSQEPLLPTMILSNEPGYYREDAFGIRIENLITVQEPAPVEGGDIDMLSFETLTYVPIDRRLIDPSLLTHDDRDWLNRYHQEVNARYGASLAAEDAQWLADATAPL